MKKPARFRPMIAVIGDTVCDKNVAALALETGRLVAGRGAILVCGGYGGVMEHAARGAKASGGTTLGILSGKEKNEANRWIDIPIVTGIRDARNAIIARTADGVIAISGAYGTLSEIAFALNFGVPVVGLRSWDLRHHGPKKNLSFPNFQTPSKALSHLFRLIS